MKLSFLFWFFTMPFATSAVIAFAPLWVWAPFALLASILWIGTIIIMAKE
ncbi:MAG: hypothetical protein U1E51_12615 [Candidatus Binatia bacterium]|nr:hypothetical protein [Candidatus Binatia bacterium]